MHTISPTPAFHREHCSNLLSGPEWSVRFRGLVVALFALLCLPWNEAPVQAHPPPPSEPRSSASDEGEEATTREEPGPSENENEPRPPVEIVQARIAGPPGHRDVRSIRPLLPGGGRLDWSRQGDKIAFDKAGDRGLHQIYVHGVENGSERCLTCDLYELRRSHVLDPVWHPSGDHLVVQVQESARRLGMDAARLATPIRGVHSELWVIHRDGRSAWQLTRGQQRGAAVLDPHFSYEGNRLVWSERQSSVERPWGDWGLRIGEVKIRRGVPRLTDIQLFEPAGFRPGFVVATEFTPNDRGLLLAASPDVGQRPSGRDLLRYDLESGAVERLTETRDVWDDRPALSPRGDRLIWVSDRGIEPDLDHRLPYRGDLWLRIEREGREERLTYFNDPRSDHSLGEVLIDDLAWSPRGDLVALHVVYLAEDAVPEHEDELPLDQGIYLVTLDEAYRR